jgi:hypothetical protein
MTATSSSSRSGRWWLAVMGIILALAGAGFTWGLWIAWQKAEETRRWTPTPCRIISAQVLSARPTPSSNVQHRVDLRYRYEFGGQTRTGQNIRRVDGPTVHESEARKKLEAYPVGHETTCWVNPAQPDQAILQHSTRAALYTLWFPLLFVAGGIGMAWNALRRR